MSGSIVPSELLAAVADPGGGKITLLVGAGCSTEAPTNLPLTRDLAREAHEGLVNDNRLRDGDCPDPEDLALLADTTVRVCGDQVPLVKKLGPQRFLKARANEGYLLAAAMLRERAIWSVVTLNFDLALHSAIVEICAEDDGIRVISRPEDCDELGVVNVVYLHRNATADPAKWILTTMALQEAWRGRWEEVLARRVLTAPKAVFVGLGQETKVLVETAKSVREVLPGPDVFQVDPGEKASSPLAAALVVDDCHYIKMGWGEFMSHLANRLLVEHRAEIEAACGEMMAEEGFEDEDISSLLDEITGKGLLFLGALRARWTVDDGSYLPRGAVDRHLLADLLLAIALVCRVSNSEAILLQDGIVEFRDGPTCLGAIVVASGRGWRGWYGLEDDIATKRRFWVGHSPKPEYAVVAGLRAAKPADEPSPPSSIAGERDDNDVIGPAERLKLVWIQDLRKEPALVKEMLQHG